MDRDWRSLVSLSLLSLALSPLNLAANAQITPDSTLGGESSVVTPINPQFDRIDGGAIRGSNLFHSFLQFSIREGDSAYFANPEAIQTIFSRVTGSNPSQLFGKLGVLGNANLFFINPSGIIFGPNASLDIRGSFVASTANSIVFPDGSQFSTTNPQGVPLLTINVPVTVGLQFEGDSSGTIINAGDLAVGKNLALIGGTIVSTGQLSALNGEISLSTIAAGVVKLDEAGKVLGKEIQSSLISSQDGEKSGLFLSGLVAENGGITGLMVNSDGQVALGDSQTAVKVGDIVVAGSSERVSLQAQTAKLSAGKDLTLLGSQVGAVGDMTLLAQDTVRMRDSVANPLVVAAGGKLEVQGNQQVDIFALNHSDSELVSGGDMILKSASEVTGDAHFWSGGSFRIEKLDGSLGDLVSPNDPIIRSQGDVSFFAYEGASLHILAGGAVNINTAIITGTDTVGDTINPTATPSLANVTLSDGTSLVINGNAKPTLDIRAGMKREAIGSPLGTIGANPFSDLFFNSSLSPVSPPTNNTRVTNANITIGDVIINPPNGLIYITNQFQPNLSLVGGNITINGNGVLGIGGIDGNGSDVILDARGSINLNGSLIDASSVLGNSGNITLIAQGNITLQPNSYILANAFEEGNGGNMNIIATDLIHVDHATISSQVINEGSKGGNINITTSSLKLTNGAEISNSTFGKGIAGNINIKVTDFILIDGDNSDQVSAIRSEAAEGNGGTIDINTRSLFITNGGIVSTQTEGKGKAGDINITSRDLVELRGTDSEDKPSALTSRATKKADGDAGKINISTSTLKVSEEAVLASSTQKAGNAGDININASQLVEFSGNALALSSVVNGKGGDININTSILRISEGSINASTIGQGKAGNVNITATDLVKLNGSLDESSGIASGGATGNAGDINISTSKLEITGRFSLTNATTGLGKAGNIDIIASDSVSIDGNSIIASTVSNDSSILPSNEVITRGGDIQINTPSLAVTNRSVIAASTGGLGNAGNIFINANDKVFVSNSAILSAVEPGGIGNGGIIDIKTGSLMIKNGGLLATLVSESLDNLPAGRGDAGNINITATQLVSFDGVNSFGNPSAASSEVNIGAEGNGGDIKIVTPILEITNGAVLDSSTAGKGNPGNIKIENAQSVSLANNSTISTAIETTGVATQPSNIDIQTRQLTLNNGSEITASTSGKGDAGSITVPDADSISLNGNSTISTAVNSTAIGQGGQVSLNTDSLTLDNSSNIQASTAGQGQAGDITITAPKFVTLGNNSQLTVETSSTGKAGDIAIISDTITLGKDAELSATATATATNTAGGGNITLNAKTLNLAGKLGIFAETQGIAPAGNLSLQPNANNPHLNIAFTDNGFISASTTANGGGGNITISAPQTIDIRGEGKIAVETSGKGNAGNIDITSQNLNLAAGLEISASTTGEGAAGNIHLNAEQINLSQTQINAFTNSAGNAGSILLSNQGHNAQQINLHNNSQISTEIRQNGIAQQPSNIDIQTDNLNLTNSTITASTEGKGNAGSITVPNAQQIRLNQAKITASSSGEGNTGSINLNAQQKIELSEGSQINSAIEIGAQGNSQQITLNTPQLTLSDAEITAATAGKGNAGSINIPNANSVILNNNSTISTAVETTGIATQHSNIDIQTRQLSLSNNSQITASTSGQGNAGNINIPKANSVTLNNNSTISTAVESGAKGEGGNIAIQTERLALDNQSRLRASTAGEGNAGDININANDSVSFNNRSQIASAAETGTTGDGGDINLKTPSLNLTNNSQITTSSQGKPSADAGKIELQANQITLNNNSQIAATTAAGKGGSISATANSLNLSNGSQFRTTTSGNNNAGDITLKIGESISIAGKNSGIFADTDLNSSGNGGKIFIDPHTFIIRDGAAVSVNSQGKGTGGDIEIRADFLTLDNGKISAQTFSTTGGNITLRVSELLWLKNDSQISTTAGTAQAGGDGGNIDIDSFFILSNFYENNDITANAFTGRGGNISITVQGILGLVIADGLTRFSDITASSEFGLDGNIIINTAGIDPTRGLDKLNSQAVNPEIGQGCQAIGGGTNAEFYNLGRGGLPENPTDFFSDNLAGTWIPWHETISGTNVNLTNQIGDKSSKLQATNYQILPCQTP